MRTIKALACAAALAAGIATSLAQSNVYSLNVVGYYNVTVAASTFTMIANQLNTTNNTVAGLIPNGPPFAQVLKFVGGVWAETHFDDVDLVWTSPTTTLNPGEAGFYKSPSALTLTFVGEVEQGVLSNPLVQNAFAARASMVPQAGRIATDLGFPSQAFDQIERWDGALGRWNESHFDDVDLVWVPSEPTFGVGEGFIVRKVGTTTVWTRNFTVQ